MINMILWVLFLTGTFTSTIISLMFLNGIIFIYHKRNKLYRKYFEYNSGVDVFVLHSNYNNIGEWVAIIIVFPISGLILPIYIMTCLISLIIHKFVIKHIKKLMTIILDKVLPNE